MKKLLFILAFLCSQNMFAQWEPCNNGIEGYLSYCMIQDGNKIISGSINVGMFISDDNAQSWYAVEGPGILTTALYSDGSTLYIGTDYGVVKTTDYGGKYTRLTLPVEDVTVFAIEKKDKILLIGTSSGLFISKDDGKNFVQKEKGLPSQFVYSIKFYGNRLFVGTYEGLYYSDDLGENWISCGSNFDSNSISTIKIIEDKIIVSIKKGIAYSTDGGNNWIVYSSGINNITIRDFAVNKEDIYAVSTNYGIMISTDFGKTWKQKLNGITSNSYYCVIYKDGAIFAGTDGGVYKSIDKGENWVHSSNKMIHLNSMSYIASNEGILYSGLFDSGVYKSTNNGAKWERKSRGYGGLGPNQIYFDQKTIYLASENGVFISTDDGESWLDRSYGLPVEDEKNWVYCIAKKDNYLFAGTFQGVYISNNKGTSWLLKSNGMPTAQVNTLFFHGNNLFAGTENGIYFTSDYGNNWQLKMNGIEYEQPFYSFAIKEDTILAGGYFSIYCSFDEGNTWKKYRENDISTEVNDIKVNGDFVLVGTEGGVFYATNDTSKVWYYYLIADNSAQIKSLALIDETIFAATFNGLHKINISDLGLGLPNIPSAPTNLTYEIIPMKVRFKWNKSTNSKVTYNLYRGTSSTGPFNELVEKDIIGNSCEILIPTDTKTYYYVVRAFDSDKKTESYKSNIVSITITGINENNASQLIGLTPNPVIDKFTISLKNELLPTSTCEILDIMGKSILKIDGISSNTIEIDAQSFVPGIYYYRIISGEEVYISKFIKVE